MKRSRRTPRALVACLTVLVAAIGLTGPASATTGPDPARYRFAPSTGRAGTPTTQAMGMHLVGFDPAVARAHGHEVVTLPDGSRASVPAAKADAAVAGRYLPTSGVLAGADQDDGAGSTDGRAVSPPGNCGISWVSLDPIGGSGALLVTGMSTTPDAGEPWDVHWNVRISDNGGESTQSYDEYDGIIGFLSWVTYNRFLSLTVGPAYAALLWGRSFTITENGWVCFSLGAVAAAEIY